MRVVLWILPNDPLSRQAAAVLTSARKVLPRDVDIKLRVVNLQQPEVLRAPTLLIKDGRRVLARIEGIPTLEELVNLIKRIGSSSTAT